MSSPPPPPPPNPLPTTTTTTTADFLKSVSQQRPQKHSHPSIYQTLYNPQHSNSKSHHQQPPPVGMIPNSGSFPPRPVSGYPYRPHGFSNSDQFQQTLVGNVASASANPKVAGQSSVAADKGLRDKKGDDSFVIVRDRKVQVSEGASVYAQCRSWLKNGFTLEKSQPQYPDYVKSLPKPLPASKVEARKEDDMEVEENPENVDHLSAKELLQQHVKRAKKVRARLRDQRLQRIERYKDRLALLLPPVVDQQPNKDPAS